ncbi:MAG: Rieske 2Fe-2S domain-containing protein [Planctomycetota bacterium]
MPKSSGGQAPKASGGQAPKSSGGQAPKASGGQAPKASGGQAPKASGGAPPAVAAAAVAPAAKAAAPAPKAPPAPKPAPTAQVLTREMRDAVGRKIVAEYPPAGSLTRRAFISWCGVAWTTFAAASAAGGAICARFMFPNVLFEPPMSFKAGPPSEFSSIGMVYELYKAKFGVWMVRDEKSIFALSTVCTHLGCTPNWLAAEQKFKCPCHGSGFYKTGINFEGPAPRPLERYRIVMSDDGQILVDKSKKFQWEMGQWTDPESFLVV